MHALDSRFVTTKRFAVITRSLTYFFHSAAVLLYYVFIGNCLQTVVVAYYEFWAKTVVIWYKEISPGWQAHFLNLWKFHISCAFPRREA